VLKYLQPNAVIPIDMETTTALVNALKERLAQDKALQALHDENERLGLYEDAYAQPEQEPVAHWSDCAVHSEPAYPKSECDCGGIVAVADYTALSDKYVALSDKYVALKAQRTEQEPVMVLPDGSAFGVMSFPLPDDHWLYAPNEYRDGEHEPIDLPKPVLTRPFRDAVVAAVRYAVRGATMRGQETDFDPDALVQNAVYALCGPYTTPPAQPPQRIEQNFCSRCGKRTPDLITIHTCTPPQD
jgi:hypothetical protein